MTILCPVDFSEDSIRALKYAFELAEEINGNVTVLYSYRLIQPDRNGQILSFKKDKEAEAHAKFLQTYESLNRKVPYKFIIEIGFLSDSIESHIRKNHIDMVVVGREMCSSLNDHKGYSAEMFLYSITVPVVIVPNEIAIAG